MRLNYIYRGVFLTLIFYVFVSCQGRSAKIGGESEQSVENFSAKYSKDSIIPGLKLLKDITIHHNEYFDVSKLLRYSIFQMAMIDEHLECAAYHYPAKGVIKYIISDSDIDFSTYKLSLPKGLNHKRSMVLSWMSDGNIAIQECVSGWYTLWDKDCNLLTYLPGNYSQELNWEGEKMNCRVSVDMMSFRDKTVLVKDGSMFFPGKYLIEDIEELVSKEIIKSQLDYGVSVDINSPVPKIHNIKYPFPYQKSPGYRRNEFILIDCLRGGVCCSFRHSDSIYEYDLKGNVNAYYAGVNFPHQFKLYDHNKQDFQHIFDYMNKEPIYNNFVYDPIRKYYLRGYKHRMEQDPEAVKKFTTKDIPYTLIVMDSLFNVKKRIRFPKDETVRYNQRFAFCEQGIWSLNELPKEEGKGIRLRLYEYDF